MIEIRNPGEVAFADGVVQAGFKLTLVRGRQVRLAQILVDVRGSEYACLVVQALFERARQIIKNTTTAVALFRQ